MYASFFPFIHSSPARQFSGILMPIPGPTVYFSIDKKSVKASAFRTYEKLCGRNFEHQPLG